MFGSLGLPEILLIMVLALLIFGPKRLPEMGRTIGKGLSEFRKASADFKRTLNTELSLDEHEQTATTRRPTLPGAITVLDPPDATPANPPPVGTSPRVTITPATPEAEPDSPPAVSTN
jgi:TatA/E family protein of Tat protein translocase